MTESITGSTANALFPGTAFNPSGARVTVWNVFLSRGVNGKSPLQGDPQICFCLVMWKKPEGHADGCVRDFTVNRDMQAGRSEPATAGTIFHHRFLMRQIRTRLPIAVSVVLLHASPTRDPCIFCPRTVLRVRGQAIATASWSTGSDRPRNRCCRRCGSNRNANTVRDRPQQAHPPSWSGYGRGSSPHTNRRRCSARNGGNVRLRYGLPCPAGRLPARQRPDGAGLHWPGPQPGAHAGGNPHA